MDKDGYQVSFKFQKQILSFVNQVNKNSMHTVIYKNVLSIWEITKIIIIIRFLEYL